MIGAAWVDPADTLLVRRVAVVVPLLGAALVHGAVAGEHFDEWVYAGVFFLVLQLVQLALAVLAWFTWTRPLAAAVVVTGLGPVAVWVLSRTAGMPIGPADFRVPEPVGLADVLCAVLELVTVLAAAPDLLRRHPVVAAGVPRPQGRALAAMVALAALVVTAWALGPALSGGHHHGDSAAAVSSG
ncbi:MAG: hypothetical protein J7518_14890 [Nocardioidaceae bacterium]|nr:hypothetical protein [Nocardioidaceae bacterium]